MPEWNKDQKKAIETRGKGIIVSAAAGSGKTTVLVERTVRILSDCVDRLPADKLLAVTFTNEAADQMRRKLSSALEEKLRQSTLPAEKKWLSTQRDLLSLARISTINSFCLELVKRCLNEFEYDEGVRIIEEQDAETILAESFRQALDRLAEKFPEELDLLFDEIGTAKDITEYGRDLYDFLRSLPFPEEWMQRQFTELGSSTNVPRCIETVAYRFNGILDKAEKLNERIRHNLSKYPDGDREIKKNLSVLDEDQSIIRGIRNALGEGDWEKLWYAVAADFKSFGKTPKKDADYSPELFTLYIENWSLREKEKDLIKKVKEEVAHIGFDITTPLARSAQVLEKLYHFVKLAEQFAYKEKLKRNVLEFSDVEIMALSLLVKRQEGKTVRTDFAEELRRNREYALLLIDEFQDVNDLQELIFKALSDTDDLEVFGKNVFVVGDVKQSIYGFRQSNPQLFIKAKASAALPENEDQLTLVELKNNYRSRGCVINFVNLVFSQLMSDEIGEVHYTGAERLEQGASYKGTDAPTEIIFVENAAAVTEDDNAAGTDEELSVDENYAIARRIRNMIDDGVTVADEKAEGKTRPCVPRDFCILYRSAKSVESLKAALAAYGLKAASEKSKGYLRSREISLMLSMLKMIDNPMRDIAMSAVMLSPVMGFTADELARIRLLGKQQKAVTDEDGTERVSTYYKHLYQVISSVGQSSDAAHQKESERLKIDDPVLEQKCIDARNLVRKLSFYSAGMDLPALIRKIYDETELLAAVSSYENSRQKRANLRLLLEYARTYTENSDGSAAGFIRYIESISNNGKDFTQAATEVEDDNSVLVKTIHASKGLEFPFVFLCGATKKFNTSDLSSRLLLDEEFGAGLTLTDRKTLVRTETLSYAAVKTVKNNRLLSEELRLLYVAFTRARERLFIPINMKRKPDGTSITAKLMTDLAYQLAQSGGVTERIAGECSSYVEWIAAALLCSHDRQPLLDKLGIKFKLPLAPDRADITYSEYSASELTSDKGTDFYNGSPDETQITKLISRFRAKQSAPAEPAAAKLSVTEIVAAEKEEQQPDKSIIFYPHLPLLNEEKGTISAARRGTLTHLFMELADYTRAEQSVTAELDRLTAGGLFSEKERKGVYTDALKKFFAGSFYQRLKASEMILRERRFMVSFDDLDLPYRYRRFLTDGSMLQGVADCIFLEDDGFVLVDYKTDNFKDLSELYTYRTQLELYKAALDKILDRPVKACFIYSFKLAAGVEIVL